MVKYDTYLDDVFTSLSDPTRRDILQRLSKESLSVSEIAESYKISLPAISKHITYLERANLVSRKKSGRTNLISIEMDAMKQAEKYLEQFISDWESRMTQMRNFLESN